MGCHHNGKPEIDADLVAVEFVAKLPAQGHTIEAASFTAGSKIDLLQRASDYRMPDPVIAGFSQWRHGNRKP